MLDLRFGPRPTPKRGRERLLRSRRVGLSVNTLVRHLSCASGAAPQYRGPLPGGTPSGLRTNPLARCCSTRPAYPGERDRLLSPTDRSDQQCIRGRSPCSRADPRAVVRARVATAFRAHRGSVGREPGPWRRPAGSGLGRAPGRRRVLGNGGAPRRFTGSSRNQVCHFAFCRSAFIRYESRVGTRRRALEA